MITALPVKGQIIQSNIHLCVVHIFLKIAQKRQHHARHVLKDRAAEKFKFGNDLKACNGLTKSSLPYMAGARAASPATQRIAVLDGKESLAGDTQMSAGS